MNQRILFPPPIPAYQAARHPPLPVRVQVKDRQDRGTRCPGRKPIQASESQSLNPTRGLFPAGKRAEVLV